MSIADWPEQERPRERLLKQGAGVLSDAELLAIFIRTGMKGKSAVEVGRDMLRRFGSLNAIFRADLRAALAVPGLGAAKFAQLQAAFELARRALSETLTQSDALSSPTAVRDFLQLTLSGRPHEVFVAVFLDSQNRVIAVDELFRGTLTQTSVYPREVVKAALAHNAGSVILAHNHPSGVAEPSQADQRLTQALRTALAFVDVKVVDHFIVAASGTLSFAERGLL